MITIPEVFTYKNITVYPDDESCNRFYCLKSTPEIRMQDGKPVFSGLFWTDKGDGSMETTAGIAGGWINFDANLGVSEEEKAEIIKKIKEGKFQEERLKKIQELDNERNYYRQKALDMLNGSDIHQTKTTIDTRNGVSKTTKTTVTTTTESLNSQGLTPSVPLKVGEVELAAIDFTEGTVTLLEEAGTDIVKYSSAGGPANTVADNNAAFALSLTSTGAAIWYKCLQQGSKAISIQYDLKFLMRLPSLKVRAYVASMQKQVLQKDIETWYHDGACGSQWRERSVTGITKSLVDSGVIKIDIDKGSTKISDEYVSKIYDAVMDILNKKVEQIFDAKFAELSEDERKSVALETVTDELRSFMEICFEQRDVIEWKVAPQGTILNFLEKVSDEDKKTICKLVDIADPVVKNLNVIASVSAPWGEAPYCTNVGVDVKHVQEGKEDNIISLSFSEGEKTKNCYFHAMDPKKVGKLYYRVHATFKEMGYDPVKKKYPYETDWIETNGNVFVTIGHYGVVDLLFRPHPMLASLSGSCQVTDITVSVKYDSPNQKDWESFILNPNTSEGERFFRQLDHVVPLPVQYKCTYVLANSEKIETPVMNFYPAGDGSSIVYTPLPFATIDVPVSVPFIPADDVSSIRVNIYYEDTSKKFDNTDYVTLARGDDFEQVTAHFAVLDSDKKDFKYDYNVVSSRHAFRSPDKLKGEGTILLPLQKVDVYTNVIKQTTQFISCLLNIESMDGSLKEELIIEPDSANKIEIMFHSEKDVKGMEFKYSMQLFDMEGGCHSAEGTWKGGTLMLVKPKDNN